MRRSAPCSTICVAMLCRSLCGLACEFNPFTVRHTVCAVSAFPRTDTNSARCTPCTLRSNSPRPRFTYISSASTADRPIGTILSLSPLPLTCTLAPSKRKSSTRSVTISPTRSPPAYSNSIIAWSRNATPSAASPRAAAPVRSSISRTSPSAKLFGNTFQLDGLSIFTVGSCVIRLSFSSQR